MPPTPEERTNAMLCHLLALIGILGPLIMWILKKDTSRYVDLHGRAAINFHLTILILSLICLPLCFLLIGFPLFILVGIYHLVGIILGSIKANEGQFWAYPILFNLIPPPPGGPAPQAPPAPYAPPLPYQKDGE